MSDQGQKISTIIIEDEPIARERISDLICENHAFKLYGEFEDADSARSFILNNEVDLMFVDIQMPGEDGISFVKSLPINQRPFTVFATAFDQFALDAFNLFAIDYLLKPFSKERFNACLEKIKVHIAGQTLHNYNHQLEGLLKINDPNWVIGSSPDPKIPVKVGNKTYFIQISEIEYVLAAGNYLEIFSRQKRHLIRGTMASIEEELPKTFMRIHKSSIVNIDFVSEVISIGYGGYEIKMRNGIKLRVSDSYRRETMKMLGIKN